MVQITSISSPKPQILEIVRAGLHSVMGPEFKIFFCTLKYDTAMPNLMILLAKLPFLPVFSKKCNLSMNHRLHSASHWKDMLLVSCFIVCYCFSFLAISREPHTRTEVVSGLAMQQG